MEMSFRWYGELDKVKLENIKQIPCMEGIVTALYDVPVGEVWPVEKIQKLKETVEASGLRLSVIESVPVHEEIKLGTENAQKYIDNYKQTIRNLGQAGIDTVCYNFMPVFDWTRTEMEFVLPDGSTGLRYEQETIDKFDIENNDLSLPGWDVSYTRDELNDLIGKYQKISHEMLWENLQKFLEEVIPVAIEAEVKLAIHPDDPPWDMFGIPRIITNEQALERVTKIVDSPYNGITFCTGSLGANSENDLPAMIRSLLKKNRINFVHARNIALLGEKAFQEVAHPSKYGNVDMYEIIKALVEGGYEGPIRPDHGRMIWGEAGNYGYGLYDRALGAVYLKGLEEAIIKDDKK
ncbi:MAG: mannonate dehydratase [Streptococcaceae bacterium]|nr:mannonate dehydratase [Streptococcaceae bacterium]